MSKPAPLVRAALALSAKLDSVYFYLKPPSAESCHMSFGAGGVDLACWGGGGGGGLTLIDLFFSFLWSYLDSLLSVFYKRGDLDIQTHYPLPICALVWMYVRAYACVCVCVCVNVGSCLMAGH